MTIQKRGSMDDAIADMVRRSKLDPSVGAGKQLAQMLLAAYAQIAPGCTIDFSVKHDEACPTQYGQGCGCRPHVTVAPITAGAEIMN